MSSVRRNLLIADIFARLDYMEREGRGLGEKRDGYLLSPNYTAGKEPVFYSDRTQFRISFPNLNYDGETVKKLLAVNPREQVGVQVKEQVKVQVREQVVESLCELFEGRILERVKV